MYEVSGEQARAVLMQPITDDPNEYWVECQCGAGASFEGPAADISLDELLCDECFGDLLDEHNGGPEWCWVGDELQHERVAKEGAALRDAILLHLNPEP